SAFKAYFFGNLDPLRLTVQNDVDISPAVPPEDVQYLEMVLQLPYIDCQYGNETFDVTYSLLSRVVERIRVVR
ncbi:MAG TPA: hypothetical protein PKZ34_03630, partial [Thermotogota bacterium]|nr:hypothetical protein [Thermotogota bacterium]